MLTLTLLGLYPLIPATAANGPWWMWFAGVFGVTFPTGNAAAAETGSSKP